MAKFSKSGIMLPDTMPDDSPKVNPEQVQFMAIAQSLYAVYVETKDAILKEALEECKHLELGDKNKDLVKAVINNQVNWEIDPNLSERFYAGDIQLLELNTPIISNEITEEEFTITVKVKYAKSYKEGSVN